MLSVKDEKSISETGEVSLFYWLKMKLRYESKHFWYCNFCGKVHTNRTASYTVGTDYVSVENRDRFRNELMCSKGISFINMLDGKLKCRDEWLLQKMEGSLCKQDTQY